MPIGFRLVTKVATLIATLIASPVLADETIVSVPTRPGVTQSFLYNSPDQPKAVMLLFPGGLGNIGIHEENGKPRLSSGGNFLIRSRSRFVDAGMAAASLDTPSDHREIDGTFRVSTEHLADVRAVLAWIRQKTNAPVWLVGTSMGTISGAYLASSLGDQINGLELTSTVVGSANNGPTRGVLSLDLEKIVVPTLVMSHKDDACRVSSPRYMNDIVEKLKGSKRVATKIIEGGFPPKSGPCDALAEHGYYGVEPQATSAMTDFILAQ